MGKASALELEFARQVLLHELPEPVRELRFHPPRLFRFDFAWPDQKVAFECEGGTWTRGGHSRGVGYASNCEKYSLAAIAGWRVIRGTNHQIEDGVAIEWVKQALRIGAGT